MCTSSSGIHLFGWNAPSLNGLYGKVVVEEYFCQDLNMPSIRVVTYEGLFGVAMMLLIVFPLAYFIPGQDAGSFENIFDSFVMIEHSWMLQGILLTDACCMLFFNYFSMNITKLSSSMLRTLLETMRTMIVWIVDMILFVLVIVVICEN